MKKLLAVAVLSVWVVAHPAAVEALPRWVKSDMSFSEGSRCDQTGCTMGSDRRVITTEAVKVTLDHLDVSGTDTLRITFRRKGRTVGNAILTGTDTDLQMSYE